MLVSSRVPLNNRRQTGETVLIFDPTQGRESVSCPLTVSADAVGPPRGRPCLLSNSKPNGSALLLGLAAGVDWLQGAPLFTKTSAALPAAPELLDRIASEYELSVVAICD
jgi:hypothetical protein